MLQDIDILDEIDSSINDIIKSGDDVYDGLQECENMSSRDVFDRCCERFSSVVTIDFNTHHINLNKKIRKIKMIPDILRKTNVIMNTFFEIYGIEHSEMFLINYAAAVKWFDKSTVIDCNDYKILFLESKKDDIDYTDIDFVMYYLNLPKITYEHRQQIVYFIKRFVNIIWHSRFDTLFTNLRLYNGAMTPDGYWVYKEQIKRTTIFHSSDNMNIDIRDNCYDTRVFIFKVLTHFFGESVADIKRIADELNNND